MSAPDSAVIQAVALTKSFGARTVLENISLDVRKGEVVALVGPSGGGKSTLLRCLVGLNDFEKGDVTVGNARLRGGMAARERDQALTQLRQESGLVFQQWHLFAHMTALANVMEAPVQVKKTPVAEARKHAQALLAQVGLAHREQALPRQMSGGEQQRAAIARALAMGPKVLFMDEPTSALDPERVRELGELLQKLVADNGVTLMLVTHEMGFVREFCSRVVVMRDGGVIADGAPSELLDDPKDARIRAFLGLM